MTWPLPGGGSEVLMNVGSRVVMVIGQRVTMVMVSWGVVTWCVLLMMDVFKLQVWTIPEVALWPGEEGRM